MKNIIISLAIICSLLSCNEHHTNPDQDGHTLLTSIMDTYGSPQIATSTIRFTVGDLRYRLERDQHRSEFTLTRNIDGIDYTATYKNGYQEYFVDGVKQEDGSYSRFQLTQYLDAFTFLQGIPHVFNGNHIVAKQLQDVTILNTTYQTLDISYKPYEGSPEDRFLLYLDPETQYIHYIAEKYQLNGEDLRFLKFVDHRYVNEVLFADYFVMSPHDQNAPIETLYQAFNSRNINEERKIVLSDISVTLN